MTKQIDQQPPGVRTRKPATPGGRTQLAVLIFAAMLLILLPVLVPNTYWTGIATLIVVYWILISGLNLVVGFTGQLSVGHVGLLAVGAYTASSTSTNLGFGPFVALISAAVVGTLTGFVVGLPSLRLRRFYFAMTTLGFATIVSQLAVVWSGVTGGGVGIAAPAFGAPFDTPGGFYWLTLTIGAAATYMSWRLAHGNVGRALIAVRDTEVAAESLSVPVFRLKLVVFTISGLLAGISGALYASYQTYITPEAFNFDLSMLFFVAVLLGGQGRIFAPMVATGVLIILPEIAAPLAQWSAFLYAALLLVVVLALPSGMGGLVDSLLERRHRGVPEALATGDPKRLHDMFGNLRHEPAELSIISGEKAFGGVRALAGVDLTVASDQVIGLIGPNGSGKTTVLNVLSGFYNLDKGAVSIGGQDVTGRNTQARAAAGVARCFQTPRLPGDLTAINNVMLGGYRDAQTTLIEAVSGGGRAGRNERELRARARTALEAVGLRDMANVRTERLQHSQQRFLEIARSLMMRPRFVLLDEPAAGLSSAEIATLAALVKEIAAEGIGVLLVEHHAELVFEVSDTVTVLNFGQVVVTDTPDAVRRHEEVIHAYLGV